MVTAPASNVPLARMPQAFAKGEVWAMSVRRGMTFSNHLKTNYLSNLTEMQITFTEAKIPFTETLITLPAPKVPVTEKKITPTVNGKPQTVNHLRKALSIIILASLVPVTLFSRTIPICPTCECTSITSALLEAQNGDILLIKSGVYKEGNIIVEKEVELTGENYPVIDGESKGEIITVHSRNVKIRGLQIQNVGSSFSKDLAAIKLERVKDCVIEDNKVRAGYFGIYLGFSQQCVIRNNYIEGNAVSEFSSGNAIHLWNCRGITIDNNRAIRHRDGIYLEFSDDCVIENNLSEKNIRYGLHFMFSDNDIYRKNIFHENQAGVAVMYSHDITMTENEFSKNWGATSYGLLLKEIKDSKIFKNKLSENTTGIYAEGCVRIHIENNDFEGNGWALKIAGNCDQNTFTGNNFLSNSFELGTNARTNMNRYEKNFWSKYSGYDLDKNGIGDVPHNPVDLFTYLVEQQPVSIILMRSLFIDLLNLSEKMNPMLTPTAFNDSEPMMQPIKW